MSTNLKKQKAERALAEQKKSDLVLYKLMISFVIAVVGICGMLSIGKSLRTAGAFRENVLPVLLVLSGAAMVAAIVYFALQRSRHTDESAKIFTSANILGTSIVLFVSCLYYEISFDATQVVLMMISAIVLYFVFNIFRGSFFLCSIAAAAGLNLIRMASFSPGTIYGFVISTAAKVLGIAAPLALIVIAILIHNNKGVFMNRKVLGKNDRIFPTILVSVIALAGTVLTIAAPAIAIYPMIAVLVVYLAIAIANIIRMM